MLAVVAAGVLAALAVEHRADGTVNAVDSLRRNTVDAADRRAGRITDSVLRALDARRGDVVGTVEAGGENIASRAEETADGAVDRGQDARAVLARHVLAARTAALAVGLTGVLAVRLAVRLAGRLAGVLTVDLAGRLAGVLAGSLAGVLAVRHLFLRITAIFFTHIIKAGDLQKKTGRI